MRERRRLLSVCVLLVELHLPVVCPLSVLLLSFRLQMPGRLQRAVVVALVHHLEALTRGAVVPLLPLLLPMAAVVALDDRVGSDCAVAAVAAVQGGVAGFLLQLREVNAVGAHWNSPVVGVAVVGPLLISLSPLVQLRVAPSLCTEEELALKAPQHRLPLQADLALTGGRVQLRPTHRLHPLLPLHPGHALVRGEAAAVELSIAAVGHAEG